MKFVPEQKNGSKLNFTCALILLIGCVLFFVPSVLSALEIKFPAYPFTFTSVILFIAFMFLFIRYRMTSFEYIIKPRDDGFCSADAVYASDGSAPLDFVVYKSIGARQGAMECVLSVADFMEAIPLRKGERSKADVMKAFSKEGFTYYDYTLTFMSREKLELIFLDGQKYVGIIIEDDNPIAEYFRKISK